MNIYETFETDSKTEKDGLTIDYGSFSFKIARAGGSNKKYNKLLETLTKPFRRAIQTETMNEDKSKEILIEVYAKTVVIGWDGITDKDNKPLVFSVKNCIQVFSDLPDLFSDIQTQANQAALFRKSIVEEDSKN